MFNTLARGGTGGKYLGGGQGQKVDDKTFTTFFSRRPENTGITNYRIGPH